MDQAQTRAPFGTLLGVAPGGVPVYSSNYDVGAEELDRSDFVSLVDDIYMGYKWQCVELARRWLYTCHGLIFEEVGMAYEIFGLTSLRDPESGKSYPLESFRNGSKRPPEVGCMIIWDEGGEFEHTGHVAIVTAVYEDRVAIIEQNNRDEVWPDGQTFSREISMRRAYDGGAWLRSPMKEGTILGWARPKTPPTRNLICPPARSRCRSLCRSSRHRIAPTARGSTRPTRMRRCSPRSCTGTRS